MSSIITAIQHFGYTKQELCTGPDKHTMDISNGNSSIPRQADMPWEGATLLPMRKGEKKKTEGWEKEVISEVGVIEKKNPKLN